ncbi:copper homeostasis periplasmic binding protein CopC [Brevundimonas sp. Root1423]|uniref:copper homeostasis periplasmic binding protein CopC n=1 Tax=Brevundimonas sp. Root1423 TaxID=1736462 RepID=UPI0006F25E82|nr:copper homeostasis periplasmic binding protein CopC [Brevundimonas sp. Root1423]KQY85016.1 copper resistance protein CopC [Brevundimonas sp. Root1423]
MRIFDPVPYVAIAAVGALAAGPASAHARLIGATPAPNATVAATRSVSLTFSERTIPAFSGFDVVNAAGEKVAITTSVAEDGKTLTGTLARPLAAGAYRVDWRIASSDGHRMTGSYTFSVR